DPAFGRHGCGSSKVSLIMPERTPQVLPIPGADSAGRAGAFDHPLELVEERRLAGEDLVARLSESEPAGAIDLGKLAHAAGARRPFHGEEVAADRRRVTVALDRPGLDPLAAGLPYRRQPSELAVRREPGLLGEFAPRRGEPVLAGRRLALGDRPGALI